MCESGAKCCESNIVTKESIPDYSQNGFLFLNLRESNIHLSMTLCHHRPESTANTSFWNEPFLGGLNNANVFQMTHSTWLPDRIENYCLIVHDNKISHRVNMRAGHCSSKELPRWINMKWTTNKETNTRWSLPNLSAGTNAYTTKPMWGMLNTRYVHVCFLHHRCNYSVQSGFTQTGWHVRRIRSF